jgi:hypothetical protein
MSNGFLKQVEAANQALGGVPEAYLLLVQVDGQIKANPQQLSNDIQTIHTDYMNNYGSVSRTIFDMEFFSGPYDFAVAYVGTMESSSYLVNRIHAVLGVGVKTWCLPGIVLDLSKGLTI